MRKVCRTAIIKALTGIKNKWRKLTRQDARKHTAGIVTPPIMKPNEATRVRREGSKATDETL
jgi:hypothetical protein